MCTLVYIAVFLYFRLYNTPCMQRLLHDDSAGAWTDDEWYNEIAP